MTDLSQFADLAKAQDDGIDVVILHPKTGEELGITVKVAGPDSDRQKKARNAVATVRMQASRNRRPTIAELNEDALKVTAAAIIEWSGVVENGNPVELTPASKIDVLTRYPFIREQVDAAVGDRAGFIKG